MFLKYFSFFILTFNQKKLKQCITGIFVSKKKKKKKKKKESKKEKIANTVIL